MDVLIYSALMGAKIIEKHFTHDKKLSGNDHYHSMDINDLKLFKKKLSSLKSITGSFKKKSLVSENKSRINARRSIYAKKNIKKGQIISISNIIAKRPATGISPSKIDKVIGKKATRNIIKDNLIKLKDLN